LSGYLLLARKLHQDRRVFAGAWNFGPEDSDVRPVSWVVDRFCRHWGSGAARARDEGRHPHEARFLKLDCSKARAELGWRPRWDIDKALEMSVEWTKAFAAREKDLLSLCHSQIAAYGDPHETCVP
jgi:CDP-glucose 4,6-dehydratase